MALIADGVDAFEGASIDEAYVDLSSLGGFDEAEAHARALKARVREREELTCSVGLGPNKLVAKIASDFQKPDGLTVVRPDGVLGFLGGLRVRVIPGIGPKTEAALGERGISHGGGPPGRRAGAARRVVRQARARAPTTSRAGSPTNPVSNEWERKSVGEQGTFERGSTRSRLRPRPVLRALAAEVFRRFAAEGFRGGSARSTVTVRFTGFVTVSRSRTTTVPQRSLETPRGGDGGSARERTASDPGRDQDRPDRTRRDAPNLLKPHAVPSRVPVRHALSQPCDDNVGLVEHDRPRFET